MFHSPEATQEIAGGYCRGANPNDLLPADQPISFRILTNGNYRVRCPFLSGLPWIYTPLVEADSTRYVCTATATGKPFNIVAYVQEQEAFFGESFAKLDGQGKLSLIRGIINSLPRCIQVDSL